MKKISKKEFLANSASARTKRLTIWILTAVWVVAMIIGYFVAMNTPVYELSAVSMIASDEMVNGLENGMGEVVNKLEETIEEQEEVLEDTLDDEDIETLDAFVETAKEAVDNLSINNINRLMDSYEDVIGIIENEDELDDVSSDMGEVVGTVGTILDAISGAVMGFAAVAVMLTVLGGLFRLKGFVVLGMISSTMYCILLCGVVFAVLALAVHITMLVFISLFKKEYQAYCIQKTAEAAVEAMTAEAQ